ncbi:Glutaminase liver isoform, mitochondrial [Microtus ochrogaster]|uniref:glutaminase n=1 Tax=Microtus ochrogaster TaxID=79684 RepID=A0A8J6KKV7_MICOH|nr:Glutaminase liver isoform, mitochondrial [Microtus ochrogaster]
MASSTLGYTKIPFCLQFSVKPLTYAISVSTIGIDYEHKFVGKEPRGLRYNQLSSMRKESPITPLPKLVPLSSAP